MGKVWIKLALDIKKHHPDLNFDLPNTHLLIEFLLRSLPILKNANFSRTGTFESHHRLMKQTMRDYQSQGAIMFEKCSLSHLCLQDALRFIFEGGRWGNSLQFRASNHLLILKDYRKGKENLPHPSLRHLCPIRREEKNKVQHRSTWRAIGMVYVQRANYQVVDNSSPSEGEIKELQAALNENYAEDKVQLNSTTSYKWCTGFIDNSLIRPISIQRSEDIEVKFSGSTEYVRVQKCLVVQHQNYVYPFFFPLWYQKKASTLTPLLRKWEGNNDDLIPLPPHLFTQHVLVLHNCRRSCVCGKKRCICVDVCAIKRACKSHLDVDCNICKNNDFLKADIHADTNEFMVFDASFGFELDR